MYGFDHGAWMLGGWIAMLLLWLLPFVLVLVAIWFVVKNAKSQPREKAALEILEEAYARREIGRDEFLQKRDDLQKGARNSN
ncbi:MAG: SHOCT domain-containing protein [Betaproteobacteria bacterium]|nr:SHOCT domain-containing protein [Betaproteobacteria bacterium]